MEFSTRERVLSLCAEEQDLPVDLQALLRAEDEARKLFANLLSGDSLGDSSGPTTSKNSERISDLYVELNTEKRYSLELEEKLRSAEGRLASQEQKMLALSEDLSAAKSSNSTLREELDQSAAVHQQLRSQIRELNGPRAILERLVPPVESSAKVDLLKSRIRFLEEEVGRLANNRT